MTAHVRVDGIWVDTVFPCGDVEHSTRWVVDGYSGDYQASIPLSCPKTFEASFTSPGKTFEVFSLSGLRLWSGLTSEPDRTAEGVTIHAAGIGSVLGFFPAIYDADSGGGTDLQPTSVPNDAVDYNVASRAAPFKRGSVDLGSTAIAEDGEEFASLGELLQRAAIIQGKHLVVDSDGYITFEADPTTPSFIMNPGMGYMGTTDDQFVTTLFGYYKRAHETKIKVTITGTPTGGTFTLSGNGATTAATAYNASIGTVQTNVRALGGVFALATVTSPASFEYVINLTVALGATLTAASALTGGTNPGVVTETLFVPAIVEQGDDEAAEQFGFRSRKVNMFNLGPITSSAAQSYINGRFALVGARMGYTAGVDVDDTNCRHISGGWASARYVKAGQMLQIPGVTDSRSNPTTRASQNVVLSEVRVVEETYPTAFAAPIGFSPRDFEGALAPPENPSTTEAA